MKAPSLTKQDVEDIRSTPKPPRSGLCEKDWNDTQKRINALNCVLAGAPVITAAKRFGVNRRTITRMLSQAVEFDGSGKRWGHRACVPYFRISVATSKSGVVPNAGHPFAMEAVLKAEPWLGTLVNGFNGNLPSRKQRSPPFNRFFKEFRKYLDDKGHKERYPLNTPDRGRRALIDYIRRHRAVQAETGATQFIETAGATRLEHIFRIAPGDRSEFDEHSIDIDGWLAIPDGKGGYRTERVRHLWLLAQIDVGSGAIMAWGLVVGRKYDRFDVLSTFSSSLTPWERRELTAPDMAYASSAWMPSCNQLDGEIASAAVIAMDNDSSHLAGMTLENLLEGYKGILHYGRSGMGEGRPYIEAFFKRIENELFRMIAGGFSPETDVNEQVRTSTSDPRKNPIVIEMLEDLIDTYATLVNVAARSERETRSPRTLWEEYERSGAWMLYRPSSMAAGRSLTIQRFQVTISKAGKLPVVYRDYARYTAPALVRALMSDENLIGRSYDACYEDWQDIRTMTLFNEDGDVAMRLHVKPPYAAAPHSLPVRKRAAAWARKTEGRETADMEVSDNVQAYYMAVRKATPRVSMPNQASPLVRDSAVQLTPSPLDGLMRPGLKLR